MINLLANIPDCKDCIPKTSCEITKNERGQTGSIYIVVLTFFQNERGEEYTSSIYIAALTFFPLLMLLRSPPRVNKCYFTYSPLYSIHLPGVGQIWGNIHV